MGDEERRSFLQNRILTYVTVAVALFFTFSTLSLIAYQMMPELRPVSAEMHAWITLSELTGQMRLAFSRTYALELFLYAGLLYLVLTLSVAKIVSVLGQRLNRHDQDAESGVILGVGH